MVEMELEYLGNLNVKAKHGPSGTEITTAAPVDNHGDGSSFSPSDLMTTSLGACILTILGIQCEKEGISLEGVSARVEKHMEADPRRIGRIFIAFQFTQEYDANTRSKIQQLAFCCPVCESINPDIELDFEFHFPG